MKNLSEDPLTQELILLNVAIEKGNFILMDNSCVIPISLEDDTLLYVEDGQYSVCNINNHVFGEC
tara:strand:- start:121208 stop:121402 length:195 start_codon:yes stop_codon:yes gene_type:complete